MRQNVERKRVKRERERVKQEIEIEKEGGRY
jgi:hypothetical protein